VERFRGDTLASLGPIGLSGLTIEDDGVRVSARLEAPAFCYLISLEADGGVQLCWPTPSDSPGPMESICYPPEIAGDFVLNDGHGVQAFVLVSTTKQLPAFEKWDGRVGLEQRWKTALADGVWRYDGQRITREDSGIRGEARRNTDCPTTFRDICEYLTRRADVEAIQAIAFPVKAKK
jgi:hypothetical protein